ncbi:methyltransferase type 12 [Thermodesulfatator indicus DSM 15286]|uniref:Methyltransferase type 12 n=1 Tax=Thermodesulfatator indicus (strain DSM 15286 / JCM 11887 / CIR29812) TaxID=667014 RepID=F8A9T0_THEID|nr:class I SAM-dependent methyltransferase [Thermodesulfatator indicus]AEH45961.1 methyltransferase type 12 [Thermodesulfatator indicus DSM 15286]
MKFLLLGILAVLLPLAFLKLCYALGTISVIRRTKGALFVSTSRAKIKAILDELEGQANFRLVDLGCGDGRFLRAVYQRFGIAGEGYEINPWAYFLACLKNRLNGAPVKVYRKNFFKADLSTYDVIFFYLFPDLLLDLAPKLRKEAKPGTIIISANFPLPGFNPYKVLKVEDPIYFYRV